MSDRTKGAVVPIVKMRKLKLGRFRTCWMVSPSARECPVLPRGQSVPTCGQLGG